MKGVFLVTGGAGFIGSHLVKRLLKEGYGVIVLDWLTYAGNPENLEPNIKEAHILFPTEGEIFSWVPYRIDERAIKMGPSTLPQNKVKKLKNYEYKRVRVNQVKRATLDSLRQTKLVLVVGSITDRPLVKSLISISNGIFHLAAETHVDRSLLNPEEFVKTDFIGTYTLLEAFKNHRKNGARFLHVSTDEVYGEILEGKASESAPLNPRNPYSAAKTAADKLAQAYFSSFSLDIVIARPANNYGPFQYPEKLIPLMVLRALEGKSLPLYGDGKQRRDWIFVEDTVDALIYIYEKGKSGEVYNIAGHNEMKNIDVVKMILKILKKDEKLIKFVKDRPGHDRRYALDDSKLRKELGFNKITPFEEGLQDTVNWYLENRWWWETLLKRDIETREYFKKWYQERGWKS